jgi:hypothetical protein
MVSSWICASTQFNSQKCFLFLWWCRDPVQNNRICPLINAIHAKLTGRIIQTKRDSSKALHNSIARSMNIFTDATLIWNSVNVLLFHLAHWSTYRTSRYNMLVLKHHKTHELECLLNYLKPIIMNVVCLVRFITKYHLQ